MLEQNSITAAARAEADISKAVFSPIIGRYIELTRDRLEGSLFGIALGDALGLPVETLSAEQIAKKFGRLVHYESIGHNKFYTKYSLPDGTWSDDTQLTAALFDAFADARGYSLPAIISRHIEALNESRAGWGGSTIAGVEALIAGIRPEDSEFRTRLKSGTGNGIPMKIGAVAAYLAVSGGDDAAMFDMVREISSLSHRTSMSVSAGLAHTAGLLYCYSCEPSEFSVQKFVEIISTASALGQKAYPETLGKECITARLKTAGNFREKTAQEIIDAFGGGGCYVYDSIPFSYAFFLRNLLSFDAVIDVINAGGDTDSNGAIVGSLQGALLGRNYLPPQLLHGLQQRQKIAEAARRFCENFGISV